MKNFLPSDIINVFTKKNYELKTNPYEMNIFGVRNNDAKADTFDDVVGLLYKTEKGFWQIYQFEATTDPGSYYREKPMNVNGTAIIIPMQHKACYKIGVHHGYEAMQQIAPMSYVRDNNKDKVLDFLYKIAGFKTYREIGATNIHHASNTGKSTVDYNWSAGCQVIADIKDFDKFMSIIKESVNHYKNPNVFDYTLLEIEDFA